MLLLNLLQQDQPDWHAIHDAVLNDSTPVNNHRFWRDILNFVCSNKAPLCVAQLIIQQHPEAVKQKNNNGDLPLHCACRSKQSFEVIDLLVQTYPDAVKQKVDHDMLPLHLACVNNQSFEVVQLLVQQHPDALKQKDSDGLIPLHSACRYNQSFEVIDLLVRQYPDAVKQKVDHDILPLHFACGTNQSFEVIDLLIRQYPDAVKQKDDNGDLPLHFACRYNQSFEVIDLFVRHYPDAVKRKDCDSRLPLHFACGTNQSLEVIDFLVRQYPDAVKQKDDNGSLPLHIACGNNQSFEVIDLLVRQYPDAVKQRDSSDSSLPLHYACRFNQSFEVIDLLVRQYPNAVKRKCDSSLPLHLACTYNQSFEVIDLLVRQYPDAVKQQDCDCILPLHYACAHAQSFEVIDLLIRQYPDAVKEKDSIMGMTPLDIAKSLAGEGDLDFKTVEWLEAIESGRIILNGSSPPALTDDVKMASSPTRLSPACDENPDGPSHLPAAKRDDGLPSALFVDTELAKPSAAVPNESIAVGRRIVEAVLEGKNKMAAVSLPYVESILTEEIIGQGYFGTVYKGTDTELHRSFAVKAINTDVLWLFHSDNVQQAKETFQTEQKALSLLRHPNVAALYAYSFAENSSGRSFLVYELAEKGSLETFWKDDLGRERLSLFRRRIQVALDVMTAIQFLHVGNDEIAGRFHRDIKSANIVLQRDFTAQLIDCGLANFAVDDSGSNMTTGLKGSIGYLCPKYGSGGMQFERSCDIFSFGVVLAELWTGKLQNHKNDERGTSFNFDEHYISGKEGKIRDIKMDLDSALGYHIHNLPRYMEEFADLAIGCMQPDPEKRPAGDAVMEKLWAILSKCCSHNTKANSGIIVGDSVPSSLGLNSKDKCMICRTFPPVSPHGVCAMCKSAEEWRMLMPIVDEMHGHVVETNAKLVATLPILSRLDIRLNNPVPRLFIFVPALFKRALGHPKDWLRNEFRMRYRLYFVCIHSMKAIEPPLQIIMTKCWVEKVAPVLAMSLVLLQRGLKQSGGGIKLGYSDAGLILPLSSTRIAELLEEVSNILIETGNAELLFRLRYNKELDEEDINQLNGDAYELIVEKACEERGWRDCMEPVRKNGSPQIFWVSKEDDTSNGK